jgi:hypothetical protein
MGGVAVAVWGNIRATRDVDAMIELTANQVPALVTALSSESLSASRQDFYDAFHDRGDVSVFDDSGFHVDAKFAKTASEKKEVALARRTSFKGGNLNVVGPEETIAFKVQFGTSQDVADARSIVARQGDKLNRKKLRAVAIELSVTHGVEALLLQYDQYKQDTKGPGRMYRGTPQTATARADHCSPRCWHSTSSADDCQCTCGGANHGSGHPPSV